MVRNTASCSRAGLAVLAIFNTLRPLPYKDETNEDGSKSKCEKVKSQDQGGSKRDGLGSLMVILQVTILLRWSFCTVFIKKRLNTTVHGTTFNMYFCFMEHGHKEVCDSLSHRYNSG